MTNEEKYQAVRAIMKEYVRLADKILIDLPCPVIDNPLFKPVLAPLDALEVLERHFDRERVSRSNVAWNGRALEFTDLRSEEQ